MSQRAYARYRGCSPSTVHQAIQRGRITLVDGKIDPELADRQWASNTDNSVVKNSETGNPHHKRAEDAPPDSLPMESPGGGNGSSASYARARAARETFQAQLAQLQLQRERGEVVDANEVKIAAFNAARRARDQLMALPDRAAAIVAALETTEECHEVLREEVERICKELSNGQG